MKKPDLCSARVDAGYLLEYIVEGKATVHATTKLWDDAAYEEVRFRVKVPKGSLVGTWFVTFDKDLNNHRGIAKVESPDGPSVCEDFGDENPTEKLCRHDRATLEKILSEAKLP